MHETARVRFGKLKMKTSHRREPPSLSCQPANVASYASVKVEVDQLRKGLQTMQGPKDGGRSDDSLHEQKTYTPVSNQAIQKDGTGRPNAVAHLGASGRNAKGI